MVRAGQIGPVVAMALAHDHVTYGPDGTSLYDADDLAACLLEAEARRLWWDARDTGTSRALGSRAEMA